MIFFIEENIFYIYIYQSNRSRGNIIYTVLYNIHYTLQGRRKMKMTGGAKTGCKAANLGVSGGMPPIKLRF